MKDEALMLALEALEYNDHLRGQAITAIKQALKQSVAASDTSQKPVAEIEKTQHEREWVGLTDWEIEQLHTAWVLSGGFKQLCDAIEAKLKDKNT